MLDPASKDTWAKVTLADCCEEIGQRLENPAESGYERFVGLEHLESGETSIRCWGSTEDVTSSMKLFKAGDILVGRRNVYLRRAAEADFDGVCSGDAIVLRPRDGSCLPNLLPFILNSDSFWEYVSSQADGTMSKRITVKRLMAYEFALPPLEEQQRTANLLKSIDHTTDRLLHLRASQRTLLLSLYETLASRDQYPRDGPIADFCEFITDGDHNPPKRVARGIPHLVVAHIRDGIVDETDCTYISAADYRRVSKRYSPRGGDVLLSCVGSVGQSALVPPDYVFSADRSLAIYRPDRSVLLPEFALWLLRSPPAQHYFRRVATGTAQLHLYLDDLRRQIVQVPSIDVQEVAVQLLRQLEKRVDLVSHRISRIRETRSAALHQLVEVT